MITSDPEIQEQIRTALNVEGFGTIEQFLEKVMREVPGLFPDYYLRLWALIVENREWHDTPAAETYEKWIKEMQIAAMEWLVCSSEVDVIADQVFEKMRAGKRVHNTEVEQ